MNDLEAHLRHFKKRIRLRYGWLLTQQTFWLPALAGLLIQVSGRIFLIEHLYLWTILVFPLWLGSVVLAALFKPLSAMHVARCIDQELALKERLSTALALQQLPSVFPEQSLCKKQSEALIVPQQPKQLGSISLSSHTLIQLQQFDALAVASTIIPSQAIRLPWLPRPLATSGFLLALVLCSLILPNPQLELIKQRAIIEQAIKEEAKQIQITKQSIEASQDISPEIRQELLKKLEELLQSLQHNPGDLEQALVDLSKFEQENQQKLDPNLATREATLRSLAAQLAQTTIHQKQQGSFEVADQALDKLADQIKTMDKKQQQQLAQNLAQSAALAAQSGDSRLSQALASLANEVQSGTLQSIRVASQNTRVALSEIKTHFADQTALQHALSASKATKRSLAQVGQKIARSNGNSILPGQQGSRSSTGQNPGQPNAGGGTSANKLPPATGNQGNVRPQGNAPNVSSTQIESRIYVPRQSAGNSGAQLFIPGQETEQGQTETIESQNLMSGISNPAIVPYTDVFYNYLYAANQALDQDYIPANLVDFIRLYFSSLEP